MGERWFVGAGTAHYSDSFRDAYADQDRPELAAEIDRMRDLFVGLGYQAAPGFGVDLDQETFRSRLRDFVRQRTEDDTVVVYYTGHGVLQGGSLYLPMSRTTDDLIETALPASYFTGGLLSGETLDRRPLVGLRRVLFLIDTCHAGAVLDDAAVDAQRFLARMQNPDTKPLMALVVAARPTEQAGSGAFTQAFVDAVNHRATGGHEPEYLALDGIVNVVNANTPGWQHARLFLTGDGATEFVPNPRHNQWLRGLDLRTQALEEIKDKRRADVTEHVVPRAQGLDAPGRDDLWLFEGRHGALREACSWLRADDPSTLVVTGDPGSGKSALLSRLYVLADKSLRRRVTGLDALPEDTIPALGSIARFVHARGMAAEDLMHALCEAAGRSEPTMSPGAFLAELGDGPPLVVVVDAVDEAIGKRDSPNGKDLSVVQQVLQPLIAGAARTRLRLMIGTRRHLLDPLGTPLTDTPAHRAVVLDLDDAEYADRASIRRYIESCLLQLDAASPYIGQKRGYLDAVIDALADAAGNSFLVALITARSLALTPQPVDPYDQAWRAGLPREAAEAMREDLDRRLGPQSGRARDLLLPLAYAHGTGLPWEDIWPRLVRRLTDRWCSSADLDWLIEQAGYYVTEATAQGGLRSVYRLYHESLGEHLRGTRPDPAIDEAAVTAELTDQVPRLTDGHPDWDHAHPYTRENLATHAAVGGVLDDLVTDPRLLLAAEPPHLLAALASANTPDGVRAADAYRRADTRLRRARRTDRPAYLQLAARCGRAPKLAEAIALARLPLTWTTPWAIWRQQTAHSAFTGHSGPVNAVAIGHVQGRTVFVTGSRDQSVRVWDAATGTPVGDPLRGHYDSVTSVTMGQVQEQ